MAETILAIAPIFSAASSILGAFGGDAPEAPQLPPPPVAEAAPPPPPVAEYKGVDPSVQLGIEASKSRDLRRRRNATTAPGLFDDDSSVSTKSLLGS